MAKEEYISKIVLELQPRSRRGYRRLFGIRENQLFNEQLFSMEDFTKQFLHQFNNQSLQKGQHIKCQNLIIAVKQIHRRNVDRKSNSSVNTEVEYCLRGISLKKIEEKSFIENAKQLKEGKLNESFLDDLSHENNLHFQLEEIYSCYCSQCQKCLQEGDFFIKTQNWSRPILCLTCYDRFFTQKCVRCTKSITFDQNSLGTDGLASIRFVEYNGFYWHSDCCSCIRCSQLLIGHQFYQDQCSNQLFCIDHLHCQ